MAIDWQTFWLTLQLAITVSAILLVLGLPVAYWIAFSHRRWKFLVEAVVALPIVLPPTVLGFYVLVALGPRSPLGRWWIHLTGHTLAFTFSGLVIGSILYSLPFAVQPFAASFAGVDRKLIAASAMLGASPLRTFFRVIAPLSVPGLITGICIVAFRSPPWESLALYSWSAETSPASRGRFRLISLTEYRPPIMRARIRRRCCCLYCALCCWRSSTA